MAGKSTLVRQVGILCILAQIGCFVPALKARIGIVDRLFSRVGSTDDISRDKSSFRVEMEETAHILKYSTPHSLVLMDEVGRGTATYDGFALAVAILEDLHDRLQCRAVFATHYHELHHLAVPERCKHLIPMKMAYQNQGDQHKFLFKLVPGVADESYGIHVAKMAGVPDNVVQRAVAVLEALQESRQKYRSSILHQFESKSV